MKYELAAEEAEEMSMKGEGMLEDVQELFTTSEPGLDDVEDVEGAKRDVEEAVRRSEVDDALALLLKCNGSAVSADEEGALSIFSRSFSYE